MTLGTLTPPFTTSPVAPASPDGLGPVPSAAARVVTALIVGVPFLTLVAVVFRFWGHGVHYRDLIMAAGFYVLTGHAVTVGFHRMLTHRAFIAVRPLRLVLVALGSMAYEGGPISWVATHRRHHVFADTEKDPHTPVPHGTGAIAQFKGLWHAHWGWLFTASTTSTKRYAPDLLADRDLVVMDALFPVWCIVSMALPFGLGWLIGGTLQTAISALVWAGLVRVALLHHATWGVNSLCHTFGRRPFATKDRSTNLAVLAIISMGDSWHNNHHAFPRSSRHGLLRHQWDSSARLIDAFGRLSWTSQIHRPADDAISRRRSSVPG